MMPDATDLATVDDRLKSASGLRFIKEVIAAATAVSSAAYLPRASTLTSAAGAGVPRYSCSRLTHTVRSNKILTIEGPLDLIRDSQTR